jgi:hypothetical protein
VFRAHWRFFASTILIVTLPTRLLALSSSLSSDGSFTAYVTIASLVMNMAVLTAVRHFLDDEPVTQRLAYYDGTAHFVRFVLVSVVIAVCLLPALYGYLVYTLGSTAGAPLGEVLIVSLIGLIIALPSMWLLTRFLLAIIIQVNHDVRPVASLRQARRLTLGRFWAILGRLAFLLLALIVLAGVLLLIVGTLGLIIHGGTLTDSLFQLLVSIFALPLTGLYLTRLYDQLRGA